MGNPREQGSQSSMKNEIIAGKIFHGPLGLNINTDGKFDYSRAVTIDEDTGKIIVPQLPNEGQEK